VTTPDISESSVGDSLLWPKAKAVAMAAITNDLEPCFAECSKRIMVAKLERETGIEPATSSLGRLTARKLNNLHTVGRGSTE